MNRPHPLSRMWLYAGGGVTLITCYLLCERVLLFAFDSDRTSEVIAPFFRNHGAAPISWLVTAICHSSALSTSILVSLVNRADPPIKAAILGTFHASFATTVSCLTIAVLLYGWSRDREREFSRIRLSAALSVAFCHVGFCAVTSLLVSPLRTEVAEICESLTSLLGVFRGLSSNGLLQQTVDDLGRMLSAFVQPTWLWAWTLGLIMGLCLFLLAILMRRSCSQLLVPWIVFPSAGAIAAPMLLSLAVTALFKSSSITTCLLVALATERMTTGLDGALPRSALRGIMDIVIGANIGTTISAALVAINLGEQHWQNGAQVALAHMILKFSGMMIFSIPSVREKFLDYVEKISRAASGHPGALLTAVVIIYYCGPYAYLKLFTSAGS